VSSTLDIRLGSHVRVHLAEHCDEPESLGWGIVDHVYPGEQAFTVRFDHLRTEVVARYEIKEVDPSYLVPRDAVREPRDKT
jgi:hypothetical protein